MELAGAAKRWYIVPPSHAEFALRPALEHFSRLRWGGGSDEGADSDSAAPWLDAVQAPGDVLSLPQQWGARWERTGEAVHVNLTWYFGTIRNDYSDDN